MGIKGLLKFMKPYIEPIHIKKYAGKRVGIDAYSWLHKGAYSCSMEICLNSDSDGKLRYLDYFMHRIDLLRHYKIVPVVVFDGGKIPCKSATEQERHRKRQANKDLAMEKLKEGNVRDASELFQRAVSITPSLANNLIQILREQNIEFVVAPYEADAQLAYLSSLEAEKGGIVTVITEDSDLIAYGCKAVVFKMDRYGNGEEMVHEKVFDSSALKPSFRNFDKELLTGMCVLAGCDFLPSVPGIGIAKAYALVSKYWNLERVLSVLKIEKCDQIAEDYSKSFREAMAVFQHAQIYDNEIKRLKHMQPIPQELLQSLDGELDFLGPEMPPSIATSIAEGRLDPVTMEAFDHFSSSRRRPDRFETQTTARLQIPEAAMVAAKSSCFTVYSLREATEKHSPDKTEEAASEKYLGKALALEKLVLPLEILGKVEIVPDNTTPLKVPNNNPFKRRKDELHLDQTWNDSEKISVNEVDYIDTLCQTPESFLSMSPDKFSRKRKLKKIKPGEGEIITEQVSEVTRADNSEIVCVTLESQESVNSKIVRVIEGKKRGKKEKQKKTNCKTSENKKNTILNFFSRV